MRNLYFVYDNVANTMMFFCEAAADPIAQRSFNYACENDFKAVASDLSLYRLGQIVDNEIVPDKVLISKYSSEVHHDA